MQTSFFSVSRLASCSKVRILIKVRTPEISRQEGALDDIVVKFNRVRERY